MPKLREPSPRAKWITVAMSAEELNVSLTTWYAEWSPLFTDPRPVPDRRRGKPRPVLRDEQAAAVDGGKDGLAEFRRRMGRR